MSETWEMKWARRELLQGFFPGEIWFAAFERLLFGHGRSEE
jgi:hypothetical protein